MLVCSLLLAGCHHTQPQRPTQRNGQHTVAVDSSTIKLLELNRQMADAADHALVQMLDSLDGYNQLPCGAWVRYERLSDECDTLTPKPEETWTVIMQMRTLSGDLLTDEQKTVAIHKRELPEAVEEAIETMHNRDKAYILAPWYAAYGVSGTQTIEPYTNVQINLQLLR